MSLKEQPHIFVRYFSDELYNKYSISLSVAILSSSLKKITEAKWIITFF